MPQQRGVKVRALRHFAGSFVALFETSALHAPLHALRWGQGGHKVLPPHAAAHAINPPFTCTQGFDQAANTLIGEMMKAGGGVRSTAARSADECVVTEDGKASGQQSQGAVSLDSPQAKSGGCCSYCAFP